MPDQRGVSQSNGRRAPGALLGCRRSSAKGGLGCPVLYHETKDTLVGVVDYFRSTGKGWQTRMDEVLKEYVVSHR